MSDSDLRDLERRAADDPRALEALDAALELGTAPLLCARCERA